MIAIAMHSSVCRSISRKAVKTKLISMRGRGRTKLATHLYSMVHSLGDYVEMCLTSHEYRYIFEWVEHALFISLRDLKMLDWVRPLDLGYTTSY